MRQLSIRHMHTLLSLNEASQPSIAGSSWKGM